MAKDYVDNKIILRSVYGKVGQNILYNHVKIE